MSIALLPDNRAWVKVGPPLSARTGSRLVTAPRFKGAGPQLASSMRLLLPEIAARHSLPLLAVNMELVAIVVAVTPKLSTATPPLLITVTLLRSTLAIPLKLGKLLMAGPPFPDTVEALTLSVAWAATTAALASLRRAGALVLPLTRLRLIVVVLL